MPPKRYPLLFSAGRIGNIDIKNRIVMPALHLGMAEDGMVTESIIEFYRKRVEGGAGLIIIGGAAVNREGWGGPNMIALFKDGSLKGLERLCRTMKSEAGDVRLCLQLFHAGRYALSSLTGLKPVAPSPIRSIFTRETPVEMNREKIEETVQRFVEGARIALDSGFEMIELIGSAGYLLNQFLSPSTNKRDDEFGGDLEARLRFPLLIIREIRKQLGDSFPIIYRISGADMVHGGLSEEEVRKVACELEKAGVHALNVTGGWHESPVSQITRDVPDGAFSYLARGIRRVVNIPVFASNRIHTPEVAEELLRKGDCDFVCMGRPLIADPFLPSKSKSGVRWNILPCISCNQGCFDSILSGSQVTCLVNPEAGMESRIPTIIKPGKVKMGRILVVGAGPAGISASLTLARKGAEVTLVEKERRIGGLLRLWRGYRRRNPIENLLYHYGWALKESGVRLLLKTPFDLNLIEELSPSIVIFATGGVFNIPDIGGVDLPHVIQGIDLLRKEKAITYGKVIIVGGGPLGINVAYHLSEHGIIPKENLPFFLEMGQDIPLEPLKISLKSAMEIVVVHRGMSGPLGRGMGRSTRAAFLKTLRKRGVRFLINFEVKAINSDSVMAVNRVNGKEVLESAEQVILCTGLKPNLPDPSTLPPDIPYFVIGDARRPHSALYSIRDGYETAMKIYDSYLRN